MAHNQDELLKLIQAIEATQQALAHETDPDRGQHLREFLDLKFKQLSALTHQHSVKEYQRDNERER